uniref:Uncharacterized protein n=1 Tax=Heterosigma akashiwo TaxID=2829 RepID=A0A347ZN63_HETAK|nr:hypothetical protein [Heterosigma akashiwo]
MSQLINQKLTILNKFNVTSASISFNTLVVVDLYKLKCFPLSFYKSILLSSGKPLLVKKNNLLQQSVQKLKKYKTWSLVDFIQSLRLLQVAANTKRQVVGTLISSKKVGAQALMCQPRNARFPLSLNKATNKRKFRFRRQFPNLSKFEFFVPRSQLDVFTQKNYKLTKKNTAVNFNILKLKLFKFRYRRVKRLINIVGGFNKV